MRRKNWINKKKLFFDNFPNIYNYNFFIKKSRPNVDRFKTKIFLSNLFYKRQKLLKLNLKTNLFYLSFLIYTLKIKKRKLFFRTFYKLNTTQKLILTPSFTFLSQFFEYRSIFFKILNTNNVTGFFIYKNLFKDSGYYYEHLNNFVNYSGYNYFLINNSKIIFNKLNEVLKDKEYNNIGKVKLFSQVTDSNYYFNYYFNYNLFVTNNLEIYKIINYIYIYKLI